MTRTREQNLAVHRRMKYGLEPHEVEAWIDQQDGVCPICQIEPQNERGWHVDHNHVTG